MTDQPRVTFWFDPVCPWTWITHDWLLQAQAVRGLDVKYRLLSLAMLNAGRTDQNEYWTGHLAGLRLERVIAAARQKRGDLMVGGLYWAMGSRIHVSGRSVVREQEAIIAESLASLGLPESLAGAADNTDFDAAIRTDHDAAMALVGDDVGAPVIAVGNVAFFGPVLSPAPHGEAAGQVWDGCLALAQTPGFFELKRSRNVGPIIDGAGEASPDTPVCPT
jgi:2-hydroxychromene-2-carboxylate isomerase